MAKYIYALGRRKTATATVRLYEGKGENMINDKKFNEVYSKPEEVKKLQEPFILIDKIDAYFYTAKTSGGGAKAQIEAIRHAISRSLAQISPEYKIILKKAGFLTRDDRMKERKKTGLKKARKAPQYSKR